MVVNRKDLKEKTTSLQKEVEALKETKASSIASLEGDIADWRKKHEKEKV